MDKPQSMAIKKGNAYPQEFREEAVRYWLSSGKKVKKVKKVKEVAQELGVSDWSLSRWRQEMEATTSATGQVTTSQSIELNALELAKENGRLRRENEALLRQRDILKKAISIFCVESPTGGSR